MRLRVFGVIRAYGFKDIEFEGFRVLGFRVPGFEGLGFQGSRASVSGFRVLAGYTPLCGTLLLLMG